MDNLEDSRSISDQENLSKLLTTLRAVLPEADVSFINSLGQDDFADALGAAFAALEEIGIDAEDFLIEHGILERGD